MWIRRYFIRIRGKSCILYGSGSYVDISVAIEKIWFQIGCKPYGIYYKILDFFHTFLRIFENWMWIRVRIRIQEVN